MNPKKIAEYRKLLEVTKTATLKELKTIYRSPFKADIRLNFRTYPKWVSDAVRAAEPDLPAPPIVQLNRLQLTLQPLPVTPDTEPQS